MQRGQRAAANQRRHEARKAQAEIKPGQLDLQLLFPVQHPAEIKDHQREQVGRSAKEVEQQVCDQRAKTPYAIAHRGIGRRLAESGIGRIVGKQRIPEDQGQRAENVQGALAQCALHLRGQSRFCLFRFRCSCHEETVFPTLTARRADPDKACPLPSP